jgi:hypothetical protein
LASQQKYGFPAFKRPQLKDTRLRNEAHFMKIEDYRNKNGLLLVVKCLEANGTGYGGYDWSPDHHDIGDKWDSEPKCDGGGYYGWPLGLGIGDGKQPNALHPWIVVALADDTPRVMIDQKIKFKSCDVLYRGTMANCMRLTMDDRIDFIERNSSGSASATGWSGSASATGESGSASATGESGSASATGERGSASATGERGSASATGGRGSASATGESGSASATGERGSASATGGRGSASATGESGSASATGERGSASATGGRGSASATGESGSASATGERGIASISQADKYSIIEVSPTGIAAVIGEEVNWIVRAGAILIQRWDCGHKTLIGSKRYDGQKVLLVRGKIKISAA